MHSDARAERVLVLAPTGQDGPLIVRVLAGANIAAETCDTAEHLCHLWADGAGAVILAEEALTRPSLVSLDQALARQPVWSDLPLVILTGGGKTTRFSTTIAQTLQTRGNVTLLERPLRIITLVSAIRSALRARRRQYEVKSLLEETHRAVRQRDQFLAMLGHELRNPLAAIRTAIAVVNHAGVEDQALLAEQADIITRQSTNVSRLVDDLLDVARVTSGKIVLNRRPVDVRDVARRALQALRLSAGACGHHITLGAPEEPLLTDGDDVRIEQVMMNLLTNAVKYTSTGGEIALTLSRDRDHVVLQVRDNGNGILPDVLPHIFEPFVQAEQPPGRAMGGLGIGLTIVRSLVELHGGSISAYSEGAGKGSTFTVRLPLLTEPAPRPHAGDRPVSRGGRRILLVEDNADASTAMRRLLTLWGHEVQAAGDGAQGVELATQVRPDLMLVDIGLPDVDGYEVARRIRSTLGDDVELIALTGYGQPEDRQRAAAAGFDRYLVKPVEPGQLQRILTECARRRTHR